MKYIIAILLLLTVHHCIAQRKADSAKGPEMHFKEGDTYDFGNIPEGPDAEYTFSFKNKGKKALFIANITADCACMVAEYPKDSVMPGKKGKIKVSYHTVDRTGAFQKSFSIQSNAISKKEQNRLHIKGVVIPAPDPAAVER